MSDSEEKKIKDQNKIDLTYPVVIILLIIICCVIFVMIWIMRYSSDKIVPDTSVTMSPSPVFYGRRNKPQFSSIVPL